MSKKLTRNDQESHLGVIWEALHQYREAWLTEGGEDIFSNYDEVWSDICTAMAWVREDLGLCSEVEREQQLEANDEWRGLVGGGR